MKLEEIISSQLKSDSSYVLEEGLFKVSPIVAFYAFKDDVIGKINKVKDSVKDKEINAKQGIEKIKAQTVGKSGSKDDDIVYSYTKEQRKILAQIYKKYGSEIIKQLDDFRKNVAIPYQVIKREVAKNYMTSDKQVLGLTKEEYYKYRESGRRKIERRKDYFKNSEELKKEQDKARIALKDAKKTLEAFKSNGNFDLSAINLEKVFDESGIGIKKLNGWSQNELDSTLSKIESLQKILKDPKNEKDGKFKISGSERTGSAIFLSKEDIEYKIISLREKGISNVDANGHRDDSKTKQPYGSFKDAFSIYLLRRDKIKEIKNFSLNSEYKKFYEKVLEDGIKAAQKIYDTKFSNYMNLKNNITLNQYETKIWKRKLLGVEYSGDINDWELKIKPEDFKGVQYKEKSPKILAAEKEFDRELKKLERNLLKVMSEEDLSICRKYKLFNNFLTVKQLKDPSSMFKNETIKISPASSEGGDIVEKIDSIIEKDYDSIKDLEKAQAKIKTILSTEVLSNADKLRCEAFLKKLNPKNTGVKSDKKELEEYLDKVLSGYYSKTTAINELKTLKDKIEDFKKVNDEYELKRFNYNINKAKDKLEFIARGEE